MRDKKPITIESDGKFFNLPTVYKGVELPQKEAIRRARQTRTITGPFDSTDAAAKAQVALDDKTNPVPLPGRFREGKQFFAPVRSVRSS